MQAAKARQLTDANLKGPVIALILASIYKKIEDAAKAGKSHITHPFNSASPWPAPDAQAAVFAQLRQDGYTVEHYDNPDPGHPASSDYDQISW